MQSATGLHQVWGRIEIQHLINVSGGSMYMHREWCSVSMLHRPCEYMHMGMHKVHYSLDMLSPPNLTPICIYSPILPYYVWMFMLSSCLSIYWSLTLWVLLSVSSLLLGTMFMVCSCILLTLLLLCLFMSVCSHLLLLELPCTFFCRGCFMMFQYSVYGIICTWSELIPEILFSCYWYYFKMFAFPSYYVVCYCDSDCVWSIVMMVIAYRSTCSMGPWSPILSLDCYSRLYWNKIIVSGSIIIPIISCLSLDQGFIMVLIIIWINWYPIYHQHNASYLTMNNSMAWLGIRGSNGGALICNKAICISSLISIHFPWYISQTSTWPLLWWW